MSLVSSFPYYVEELQLFQGDLIAGGFFTDLQDANMQNTALSNIGRWNGNSWSPLGKDGSNGVGSLVRALVSDGEKLYVGGDFREAGENNASYIAAWDGNSWSALGEDVDNRVNGSVHALAVVGEKLYVGGWFTKAGDATVSNIALWHNGNWSPLGEGLAGDNFTGVVYALAVDAEGKLYVGGKFNKAGVKDASNIAAWNGTKWSPLGAGVGLSNDNVDVEALAFVGEKLYVGGRFYEAGENDASNIATWDGNTWSALSAEGNNGVDDDVFAMDVAANGKLYVGGQFHNAGGNIAHSIASWDDGDWSALTDAKVFDYVFATKVLPRIATIQAAQLNVRAKK